MHKAFQISRYQNKLIVLVLLLVFPIIYYYHTTGFYVLVTLELKMLRLTSEFDTVCIKLYLTKQKLS